MAIDYNKYINSTGTHYISNSGSDENGNTHGGKAGDQTGKEWQLRSWYNRPWNYVFRHPDPNVRRLIAELGIEAALNDLIGYDQWQRITFWDQLKVSGYQPANIKVACEGDCSADASAIVKAVGYLLNSAALKNVSENHNTSTLRAALVKAGFEVLTASKYTTGYSFLLPGDILLYEGHHASINITRGKNATGSVASSVDTGAASTPTTPSTPSTGKVVTVTGGSVNVRNAADTSGKILGIVKKGQTLPYLSTASTGWYCVQYNGQTAYISNKYTTVS